MTIAPTIPTTRREPFDGPEWTFELKFDGFRAIADTVNGRMLSKRGNRMQDCGVSALHAAWLPVLERQDSVGD